MTLKQCGSKVSICAYIIYHRGPYTGAFRSLLKGRSVCNFSFSNWPKCSISIFVSNFISIYFKKPLTSVWNVTGNIYKRFWLKKNQNCRRTDVLKIIHKWETSWPQSDLPWTLPGQRYPIYALLEPPSPTIQSLPCLVVVTFFIWYNGELEVLEKKQMFKNRKFKISKLLDQTAKFYGDHYQ